MNVKRIVFNVRMRGFVMPSYDDPIIAYTKSETCYCIFSDRLKLGIVIDLSDIKEVMSCVINNENHPIICM